MQLSGVAGHTHHAGSTNSAACIIIRPACAIISSMHDACTALCSTQPFITSDCCISSRRILVNAQPCPQYGTPVPPDNKTPGPSRMNHEHSTRHCLIREHHALQHTLCPQAALIPTQSILVSIRIIVLAIVLIHQRMRPLTQLTQQTRISITAGFKLQPTRLNALQCINAI